MRMRYPIRATRLSRILALASLAALLSGCFQVQLNGPVGGATVTLAEWWDPEDILQTTVSKDEAALIAEHGAQKWASMGPKLKLVYLGSAEFDTSTIDDDRLYLVTASGGADYDWNRDGIPDDAPTPVSGKLRAILPGAALKDKVTKINLISEAIHATVTSRNCSGCRDNLVIQPLLNATSERVLSDISRDGEVTLRDALRWNSGRHRTAYQGKQETLDELAEAVRTGTVLEQAWLKDRFLNGARPLSELLEQYPHLDQCNLYIVPALYTHEVTWTQCRPPDYMPFVPSLEGIEELTGLRNVQLGTHEYFGALEPLTRLPNLEAVGMIFYIEGFERAPSLDDMAVLARIPGLKSLGLSSARFDNHDWLRQMTSLKTLAWRLSTDNFDPVMDELRYLPAIEQVDPDIDTLSTQQLQRLQQLEQLKRLHLSIVTEPLDLNKLPALPALEELTILGRWGRGIAELTNGIERVADFPNLRHLTVRDTDLSDLSPVSGLVNLETAQLNGNQLAVLPDLSRLVNLRSLEIYDYPEFPLTDASGIAGLTGLEYLRLGSAQIESLDVLATLQSLTSLSLNAVGLTSLEGIDNMPRLRELYLFGNPITDFSPVQDLSALKHLGAASMGLTEITGLAGHPSLESLDLSWNALRTTDSLGTLPKLKSLNLSRNELVSLAGLETLTSARTITVSYNRDLDCGEVNRMQALMPHTFFYDYGITCPN